MPAGEEQWKLELLEVGDQTAVEEYPRHQGHSLRSAEQIYYYTHARSSTDELLNFARLPDTAEAAIAELQPQAGTSGLSLVNLAKARTIHSRNPTSSAGALYGSVSGSSKSTLTSSRSLSRSITTLDQPDGSRSPRETLQASSKTTAAAFEATADSSAMRQNPVEEMSCRFVLERPAQSDRHRRRNGGGTIHAF